MWKSTLGWLRATRDSQETRPRVPQLFERLEPRLLLSVVWENMQPTDPVTPDEYAAYLNQQAQESQASQAPVTGGVSAGLEFAVATGGGVVTSEVTAQEQWMPYVPTNEQTVISMISDEAGTRATVTITFPSDGYRVTDWGTVQQEIGRFAANVQVELWTGPSAAVITKLSHEYDFGQITGGPYEFAFYASQQYIESRWFTPGMEHWVPYVPTAEQTKVFITPSDSGMKANVTVTFGFDHAYTVREWGTVHRAGNTFTVNAEVERLEGIMVLSPSWTDSHEYDLGALPAGDYVFEFHVWDQPVESREFRPGPEQFAEYVPTSRQTKLFITQDGTNTKANVSLLFGSTAYVVRNWGQVQQEGNTLSVNAELEQWTGIALCVMVTEAHEYDLGALAEGDYVFEFRASGQLVESREFRPGPDQYVEYMPTPEQTSVFIVPDGTHMKAKVSMVFPTDGYVVRWGEVEQQAGTHFVVNAEVERWTGAVTPGSTTLSHEYDLGTLAGGNYYFHFYVWEQSLEFRGFQPGSAQWVQYVPTAEQTNILVLAGGAGGTKARVAIDFFDAGYRVHDWGTVQQMGNTFSVNAQVEKWTGGAATVITPDSHDYDLGSLPDGNYVFQFNAWQQPVESKEFTTPAAWRPVYRFWSPVLERHFYTLSAAERDKLINNYSGVWSYEKVAYYAFADDSEPGTAPVYRFWSGTLNTHFYTSSQAERDKLSNNYPQVWAYEGIAFYAYVGSLVDLRPIGVSPVYRSWSASLGTHFFTTSQTEMNKLFNLSPGLWYMEGSGWWACAPAGIDRHVE